MPDLLAYLTWLQLEPRSAIIGAILGVLITLYLQLFNGPQTNMSEAEAAGVQADRWRQDHRWWHWAGHDTAWVDREPNKWKQWQQDFGEGDDVDEFMGDDTTRRMPEGAKSPWN